MQAQSVFALLYSAAHLLLSPGLSAAPPTDRLGEGHDEGGSRLLLNRIEIPSANAVEWNVDATESLSAPVLEEVDQRTPTQPMVQFGERVLEEFADEPSITQVQEWAIDHARLSPFEASRLVRQARLRGALPRVRLHARYKSATGTDWDELDVVDGRKVDNDLSLNVWLEWDLAELAAGTDLARALRESRARLELRHAVVAQVTSDYFDRRLLQAQESLEEGAETVDIVRRRLRVQELNATLDGLTGGRWSRALGSDSSERARQNTDSGLRLPIHSVDRTKNP